MTRTCCDPQTGCHGRAVAHPVTFSIEVPSRKPCRSWSQDVHVAMGLSGTGWPVAAPPDAVRVSPLQG